MDYKTANEILQKKSKLYKTYSLKRTENDKILFVTYGNKLKSLLHKAEQNFYSDKFKAAMGDTKETWKVIGNVLKNRLKMNLLDFFLQ